MEKTGGVATEQLWLVFRSGKARWSVRFCFIEEGSLTEVAFGSEAEELAVKRGAPPAVEL